MNAIFELIIDVIVYGHKIFQCAANVLLSYEKKNYGTVIMKCTSSSLDRTGLLSRFCTALNHAMFAKRPTHLTILSDCDKPSSIQFYNQSRVIAKRQHMDDCRALGETRHAKSMFYLAMINDDIDISAFFNTRVGSFSDENALLGRDVIEAYAETCTDIADFKNLLVSIIRNNANVSLSIIDLAEFREVVFGCDDVVSVLEA